MKEKVLSFFQKHKSFLCVLSGAIAALPYVYEKLFALCWIGFIPLCVILFNKHTKKRVLGSLFWFFCAYYLVVYSFFVSLYPLDFAGLSNAASVLVILAAIVLIPLYHTFIMTAICFVSHLLCNKSKAGVTAPVIFAFSVMLGEYLQSLGTLGFPWARIFVTQIGFPVILQSASLFGSYFVTFVIILFCGYFGYGMCFEKGSVKRKTYISIAFVIMMVNIGFGAISMSVPQSEKTVNVVALQGNFLSSEKWSGSVVDESIKRYEKLAEEAMATFPDKRVDLLVTPETAFPITLLNQEKVSGYSANKVNNFAKKLCEKTNANVVIGAFVTQDNNEYNSVAVYNDGQIVGTYDKQHIVPFGEFLPYRAFFEVVLPVVSDLNMISTDIGKGNNFEPVECDFGKVGFLICFDSIFSDSCRKQVKNGAQLVAVSTNDSWYKESSALKQHCAHSIMRAIENGVSIVRSANTGISVVITPKGRVVSSVGAATCGFANATVPLLQSTTVYTKIGDVILWIGFIFIVFHAVYVRIKNKNGL